jgi:hypothetical protein
MESLRKAPAGTIPLFVPCCRCARADRNWDRIADKAYCPACQERLALGESEPMVERTRQGLCAVCRRAGVVCYQTFPLQQAYPVIIDLCGQHLRDLLARCLGPSAYYQLRQQLLALGLQADDLFLLHGAFYDSQGRALQPAA